MEFSDLIKTSLSLTQSVKGMKERQPIKDIEQYFAKTPRIKILRGLRGVGKTTLLLQLLNKTKGIYFSADWPTITADGIFNTGKTAIESGYKNLFIDEVHTYPNWQNDVKTLHDQFPDSHFFCSGSAAVAFFPDRRQKIFEIDPMDFGEFLEVGYGMKLHPSKNLWINESKSVSFIAEYYPDIEEKYAKYLKCGGFPTSFTMETPDALNSIYYSIHKSIRQDSVSFLKMSREKVFAMEKLAILIATSNPGELSITSLSNNLNVSKTTIYEIIDGLTRMKIMEIIRPHTTGAKLVRSEPKLLFTHPNIRMAICYMLKKEWPIGSVREESALFALRKKGWSVNTIKGEKTSPDYRLQKDKNVFVVEIGGPSKTKVQLKGYKNTILVKDDQIKVLLLN
jgi:predicted AAA+ superfamily ATPase